MQREREIYNRTHLYNMVARISSSVQTNKVARIGIISPTPSVCIGVARVD